MPEAKYINLQVILPTERYLKKFLGTRVSVEPKYVLSNKDKFGSFLYVCLDKPQYKVELNEKKFNSNIEIIIPASYEALQRIELRGEAIHLINNFIKNWFYEDFITHMQTFDMISLRMDKAIQLFCRRNNLDLDIDIQYETLKKKYYRWRNCNGEPLRKYLLELVAEEN